jgi:hypothetical protein
MEVEIIAPISPTLTKQIMTEMVKEMHVTLMMITMRSSTKMITVLELRIPHKMTWILTV